MSNQVPADLLKNEIDQLNSATENGSFQNAVNSFKSLYVHRKRKPALEINRGPGRPVGPSPDSDGVMRKSQSVHDLVHNGKKIIRIVMCSRLQLENCAALEKRTKIFQCES